MVNAGGRRRVGARRTGGGGASRRHPGWWRWALLAAALALVGAGLWLALADLHPTRPPVVTPRRVEAADGERGNVKARAPRRAREHRRRSRAQQGNDASPPARPPGQLALVIDDLGRSVDDVAALEALGVPLSYSVLPYEAETAAVVARLRAERRELLCHLPMEPANAHDPGPGALRQAMDLDALAAATDRALAQVPGAVGANNHMGSELTTDREAMGTVLDVLQRHGLFFLDSRTSAESVGFTLARSLGLPTAERDVFLDDDPDPAAIRREIARFLARSRERGAAIAIAHPRPTTLEVLREELPKAKAEGFTFVPVSFLLDRGGQPL
jgi:uncharacterized protein